MTRYHRDKRLDRLRRELHKRHQGQSHRITKDMFLNFVDVHPNFFYVHRGTRQSILAWLEEDGPDEVVREWLPQINIRNPGYFDQEPETTVEEADHAKLVALGLTTRRHFASTSHAAHSSRASHPSHAFLAAHKSHPTPRPDSLVTDMPSLPARVPLPTSASSARRLATSAFAAAASASAAAAAAEPVGSDLPSLRPTTQTVSTSLGTPLPALVVKQFPALARLCQEEVWEEDIAEAKMWFDRIRAWFTKTAAELGEDDALTPTLTHLLGQLPTFSDQEARAQMCVDQARLRHRATQGRRSRVSNSFFDITPVSDPGRAATEATASVASLVPRKRPRTSASESFPLKTEAMRTEYSVASFAPVPTPVSEDSGPASKALSYDVPDEARHRSSSAGVLGEGARGRSRLESPHTATGARREDSTSFDMSDDASRPPAKRVREWNSDDESVDYGSDPDNPVV